MRPPPPPAELAFRGFLQSELHLRLPWSLGRISLANGLTSAVFVLAHRVQNPSLLALAVWVPSWVFGYFRDRFNTVKPAIFLHVVYNAAYFAVFGVSGQVLSQSSIF
ncbi:JDVT-CTERM system glutamic-type intramembrane protease [Rhodoferax sp.]|uniref:JDVT-CTERM system glutamic-type intramembrane protease MrtJ n=1 Tax=Rhodoferax sp. TaxID=50421 RepID=UPI00262C1430|nr:JDVT-CTERM system glutamic-type intramembrane protease [Rhodoferax sp.]MDD2923581.1 JDVT-CTERM system glutamic-type intramembrane protease [Rhodoferax sp.]